MINLILQIPAADEPTDVIDVFAEAGYSARIPGSGIMPASATAGGKAIVHAVVMDASYQEILDVTSAQRPVWLILGAQDLYPSDNPAYDPEDEQSEPTITVVHKALMGSIWAHLPDRILRDIDGNQTGTAQQAQLHNFQGAAPWPTR